ncbi:protein of unknown function [Methylacidimicrobium sp. AP8]|nr:hypothetical protein [Methylacidimicrobium sp. AP8]CAB4244654.1 protein of unknown function [Methylacidimicrobium sp. AP8]
MQKDGQAGGGAKRPAVERDGIRCGDLEGEATGGEAVYGHPSLQDEPFYASAGSETAAS